MIGFGVGAVLPFFVTFPQFERVYAVILFVWTSMWIVAAMYTRYLISGFECPECHEEFGMAKREDDGYHCQFCGTIIAPIR